MAVLATIALFVCAQLAIAETAAPDAAAPDEEAAEAAADVPSQAFEAAAAYFVYMQDHAPGMVQPLLDYATAEIEPPKCDRTQKPRVGAILIGAANAGAPFRPLSGPDNDVDLMWDSLLARGVAEDDIYYLKGKDAGRDSLAGAFVETLNLVNCGDHVILFFSGNAIRPSDLLDRVLPQEVLDQFEDVSISDIWSADLYAPNDDATAAMRWIERVGLFFGLNTQQDGVLDVVSAFDISDFATNLRNREVDVTVALDTSYASYADFAGRQAKAGDSTFWSIETTGDGAEEDAAEGYFKPTALAPNHGGFAAFYASVGDTHARELGFDNGEGDGGETVYSAFTFRLASVIQNHDSVTVRALSESLKQLPKAEDAATQRYRVEANDPEMAMFTDLTPALPATDAIVITNPAPKRGAAAVERPEIDIEGSINWSAPTKAVLVDGKVAELRANNAFRFHATLKPGLNTLDVVALTADGRTHEKHLDFLFEGDKKALEGNGVRYAVVIANQNYDRARSGFDTLSTPFADADAVAAILTGKFGFLTEAKLPDGTVFPLVLKDATKHDIETVLYKIGLVAGQNDSVLVYYAGHGIYEEKTTIAFWVPSDAEASVPISYLSASSIAEALQRIQARKIVVVSDSCFSGAMLRGGGEPQPKIDGGRPRARPADAGPAPLAHSDLLRQQRARRRQRRQGSFDLCPGPADRARGHAARLVFGARAL